MLWSHALQGFSTYVGFLFISLELAEQLSSAAVFQCVVRQSVPGLAAIERVSIKKLFTLAAPYWPGQLGRYAERRADWCTAQAVLRVRASLVVPCRL